MPLACLLTLPSLTTPCALIALISCVCPACRALLRTGSRTFFAASLLLPPAVREPASALYAFCRLADDAADNAADGEGDRVAALARLRHRLGRVCEGRPLPIPVDRAFADVAACFAI